MRGLTGVKWFLVLLFVPLLSACGYLTQEENREIQQLRNEIIQAVNQEKAEIVKLIQEHKAGKLTTVELANKILEVKNRTQALLQKSYEKINQIYAAAKERKLDWWQAVLGMILAALGIPSPGAHKMVGWLFKKRAKPA